MSWEQLLNVLQQARQEHDENADTEPVACPNDGEPLQRGPNDELFCIADGWTWDGQPVTW